MCSRLWGSLVVGGDGIHKGTREVGGDLLALATPTADVDAVDGGAGELIRLDRLVVATRFEVRGVLVEQLLQSGGGFGVVLDDADFTKNRHACVLDAELEHYLRRQQAPHLTHTEADAVVLSNVGSLPTDAGGMQVEAVLGFVLHEEIAVNERLPLMHGG